MFAALKIAAILVTCFTGAPGVDYTVEAVVSAESVNGAMRYERTDGAEIVSTLACFATDGTTQSLPATHVVECYVNGSRRWHSEVANPQLLGDGVISWYDVGEDTSVLATNAACRVEPLN